MPLEKLISIKDTAKILNISVRAVYRLIASGEINPPIKIGGSSKIIESDIVNYIENLKNRRHIL